MKPDYGSGETAYTGTITVGVPPKPKRELLFGIIILGAAVLLVISQLQDMRSTLNVKER